MNYMLSIKIFNNITFGFSTLKKLTEKRIIMTLRKKRLFPSFKSNLDNL